MNAALLVLDSQGSGTAVRPPGPDAGASWSGHLAQALARGWFRGPLVPAQGAEAVDAGGAALPGARLTSPTPVDVVPAGAPAVVASYRAVHAQTGASSQSRPIAREPEGAVGDHVRGPSVIATGSLTGSRGTAPPRGDCERTELAAARAAAPTRAAIDPTPHRLHVHVERHPDGLHVWIGSPVILARAGRAARDAWLQAHREGGVAVARLVVNGQAEPGLANGARREH